MQSTSEKAIENKVCAYARSKGILVFKLTPAGLRGYPDRLFLFRNSQAVFIEFKSANGHLDPLQRERLHQLHKLQHTAVVVYDVDYGERLVDSIVKGG